VRLLAINPNWTESFQNPSIYRKQPRRSSHWGCPNHVIIRTTNYNNLPDSWEFNQNSQSDRFVLLLRRANLAPAGNALAQADILTNCWYSRRLDYFLFLFISKRLANLPESDHSTFQCEHIKFSDWLPRLRPHPYLGDRWNLLLLFSCTKPVTSEQVNHSNTYNMGPIDGWGVNHNTLNKISGYVFINVGT
jgi:hypothetical protein